MARDLLAARGLTAEVCPDLDALCERWEEGAGLLLVAEEALSPGAVDRLAARLAEQPAWSDMPILVFLRGAATSRSLDRLHALRNVTLLERPVRIPALMSTVNAALRARLRQYEVRDLMAELQEANRAKDDFLAMVSHEFRTPLNVIRGMSRILAQQQTDSVRVTAAAEKIDRSAQVLSRLVNDLLELSRLQQPHGELNLGPVDLVSVLNAAADMNRLAADAKAVRIETDCAPIPTPVLGDAVRLQQVVSNLLSNAIKFTPAEGTVTLRLQASDSQAEISVSDTGEGISPAFLPYVFEPFRQGEPGTRHGGLGLGLAIVRQFVELHGGTVAAHSDGPGFGARFTVLLPLRVQHAAIAAT